MVKEKLQLDSGFADNCSFNKDILRAYLSHALFQAQGKLVNSADLKSSAGKSNLTSPVVQLKYQLKNIFSQTFAIFITAPSQIVLKKDYTLQYQRLCSHSQDLGMGSIYQCLVCACACMCVSYYLYLCPLIWLKKDFRNANIKYIGFICRKIPAHLNYQNCSQLLGEK